MMTIKSKIVIMTMTMMMIMLLLMTMMIRRRRIMIVMTIWAIMMDLRPTNSAENLGVPESQARSTLQIVVLASAGVKGWTAT